MDNKKYIREDLKNFVPYEAGKLGDIIKLDANENPYPIHPKIKNEILKWLENSDGFSIYPDSDSIDLRNAIANSYKLDKSNVVCGVGSDQIIDCLIRGVIMPGDKVVYPSPSFSMYKSVITLNHGVGIEVLLNDDFTYDIDKMIQKTNENNAKLLILCTPNNPTGNSINLEDIRKIAENVDCMVMVDEAYGEFIEDSSIDLVNEFDNIVVLRTFSKAYGLAGLRIGYAIGSKPAIYPVLVSKPPYNINTFTQMVAQKVIENQDLYKEQIGKMRDSRDNLSTELRNMGIKVYPSDANFILIEFDNLELDAYLAKEGIQIRKMFIRGKNMYRISVGTCLENNMVVNAIRGILENG